MKRLRILPRFSFPLFWALWALLLAPAAGRAQGMDSPADLLVLARSSCGGDAWFLFNRGDGTFHAERFGADLFDGVAVGDFDGNGTLDLGTGNGLFLGLGDGYLGRVEFLTFDEIRECGGYRQGNALAFADMDGDGRLDLLYACDTRLYLFYNRGDEHWIEDPKENFLELGPVLETTEENRGCGEGKMICEVGDLDENGFQDACAGPVLYAPPILYNQGDGTFTRRWRKPGIYDENPSKIIDLDGDGHLDFVTVKSWRTLSIERGDGRGNFSLASYNLQSFGASYLAYFTFADFDQDRRLDVAVLDWGDSRSDTPGAIFLLFGEPDGSLGRLQNIELPLRFGNEWVRPSGIAAGDLDGDGLEDLAVSRSAGFGADTRVPGVIWVYHGRGDGTFRGPSFSDGPALADRIYVLRDFARRFIRGDANDDGKVNLTDAVAILQALFLGGPVPCGQALDVNDDSTANLTDALGLFNYLFLGGAPPPAPFPAAGIDETDYYDRLGCSPLTWYFFQQRR